MQGPLSDPTGSIVVKWVKILQTEKTIDIQLVKLTEVPTSLLKQQYYCPTLLMLTTKTAVCLQTKDIFHHLYWF